MKLAEIASLINGYLYRFEHDKEINAVKEGRRIPPYYNAFAGVAGRYVSVMYVSFQGKHSLTKAEALEYLAWLEAGNVGKHFKALSFNVRLAAVQAERGSE